MSNQVLAGRYRLESALASGGMGSVYRATQLGLSRTVAVKVLTIAGVDALKRFEREAQVLAHLEHPGIVKVHDFGVDDGQAFLVMELVEGVTLEQVVAGGPLTLTRFHALAAEVLEALSAAHAAGVVHRDLKPANIMLRGGVEGRAVLIDFGIARVTIAGESALTHVGTVMGTAAYMAPEQVRGEVVDTRADLYGAGCLFYELLTGRPPFEGPSADVLAAHLYRSPPPLAQFAQRPIPSALDAAICKALSKRSEDRFESAQRFKEALLAAAGPGRGEGKSGRPVADEVAPLVAQSTIKLEIVGTGGTLQDRELTANALAASGILVVHVAPDVELLIVGPGEDLLAAAKARLVRTGAPPLIACVHHIDPAHLAAAVSAGVYDVVLWPPEPTRLVRKVIQASRRRKSASRSGTPGS